MKNVCLESLIKAVKNNPGKNRTEETENTVFPCVSNSGGSGCHKLLSLTKFPFGRNCHMLPFLVKVPFARYCFQWLVFSHLLHLGKG